MEGIVPHTGKHVGQRAAGFLGFALAQKTRLRNGSPL
jgi:hypothetical protein